MNKGFDQFRKNVITVEQLVRKKGGTKPDFLQTIANKLNDLREHPEPSPVPMEVQIMKAWKQVETIVRAVAGEVPSHEHGRTILGGAGVIPSLDYGVYLFNVYFEHIPIRLVVALDKKTKEPIPALTAPGDTYNPFANVANLLWLHYFKDGGWTRLKECWHCQRWFVDRGRGKQARFCKENGGKCGERWWNRGLRRLATMQKQKGGPRSPLERRKMPLLQRNTAVALLTRLEEKRKKAAWR